MFYLCHDGQTVTFSLDHCAPGVNEGVVITNDDYQTIFGPGGLTETVGVELSGYVGFSPVESIPQEQIAAYFGAGFTLVAISILIGKMASLLLNLIRR